MGFIKGRAPGKLTGCEHNFARLLYISKKRENKREKFNYNVYV